MVVCGSSILCGSGHRQRPIPMNIALGVKATAQPPLLFSDECICSRSVEVDFGDLRSSASPPRPTSARPAVPTPRPRRLDGVVGQRYEKGSFGSERARSKRKEQETAQLMSFLDCHNFNDVNDRVLYDGEELYPIHVAAGLGKFRLVRSLVNEDADPSQKTSCGRTAVDFAKQHQAGESIVNFLRNLEDHKPLTMREFLRSNAFSSSVNHHVSAAVEAPRACLAV